jgi:hypothetical protein
MGDNPIPMELELQIFGIIVIEPMMMMPKFWSTTFIWIKATPHLFCTVLLPTLNPKTESMFHSVSFHAPYFENEWANSK